MRLYHLEWGAFPANRLAQPDEPLALLVLAIRSPLARWQSEFHYAGPGHQRRFVKEQDLHDAWVQWIARGYEKDRLGIQRGRYVDNLYTRALIGRCDQRNSNDVPFHSTGSPSRGIWGGGCELTHASLGTAELHLAKRVISSFDILFLTEMLDECAALAQDLLGASSPKLEWLNSGSRAQRGSRPMPADIAERLRADNPLDLELYRFARTLVRKRLETAGAHGNPEATP